MRPPQIRERGWSEEVWRSHARLRNYRSTPVAATVPPAAPPPAWRGRTLGSRSLMLRALPGPGESGGAGGGAVDLVLSPDDVVVSLALSMPLLLVTPPASD